MGRGGGGGRDWRGAGFKAAGKKMVRSCQGATHLSLLAEVSLDKLGQQGRFGWLKGEGGEGRRGGY